MEFTLQRTFTELEPLAGAWNALLTESILDVPFLRFEYLQSWWGTRGGGEWPDSELAVVVARQGEQLAGVAPLFNAKNKDGNQSLLLLTLT
jgi:hypothetical protein